MNQELPTSDGKIDWPEPKMPACPIVKLLAGQKALVTGASSGIGKAIAIQLAHAGCDVVVNYIRGRQEAEAVVEEAKRCSPEHAARSYAFRADVSKEDEVQAMFADMQERLGAIDILVNNAGIQIDAPFDELTLGQWQKVLDVNLTGQFLCSREAVRYFKKQGIRHGVSCAAGKIICISSVHEIIPWAGHVNYATSKGGVMLMMKSLAQEVAPYRIRVNSIGPGAIRTPINNEAWETREAYDNLLKLIPYKRIGEAEEIGRAAVWLASDMSDYVHGITLFVDGGMTLYPGFETGG